ncbi:MAG: DUF4920 domain-containing protein [Edaphocola sp.]
MKKIFSIAMAACLSAGASQAQTGQPVTYGKAMQQATVYSAARLHGLMDGKANLGNTQIMGFVSYVNNAGGWLKVTADKNNKGLVLWVKIQDKAFEVPTSAVGKMAVAEGILMKKTRSIAEQKEYLQAAGASAEELSAVTMPTEVYEIEAGSVRVFE